MKRKIRFYSIRLKLLAVYMLLLLMTSLTLFTFFVYRFCKVYKEQADSHLADVTSMSTSNISGIIEQIDQLSVSILIDRTVQSNLQEINRKNEGNGKGKGASDGGIVKESTAVNEAAISSQVRGSVFNIRGIISLRIYPKNGEEVLVGTTNREYLEYSMSEEAIYKANGAALWGMAGEEHYLCLARAILSTVDMQPLGYLVLVCKNEYLSDKLKLIPTEYSSLVYLLDNNNRVVASSAEEFVGETFPYEVSKRKMTSNDVIQDPVTMERSYYYAGIPLQNGWTLVTTVSTRQLTQGILMSVMQTAALFVTAFGISVLLTVIAVRKLMAPTQRLLDGMSAFGNGQMDVRVDADGKDEIGQIGMAYNHMADNIQNLMEEVYSLELSTKQAEIDFLKMQINPHFLYNSLDTISWLGYTSGNEDISDIAVSLAKLLRASINRADMVMVSDEMDIINSYLLIQQHRFKDKIQVERKIQEAAYGCYMPGFLLQPLIENSIIHGLEGQIGSGRLYIEIVMCEDEENLYFAVGDDGKGMEQEQLDAIRKQFVNNGTGTSIGLANAYRRLMLLYGEACQFQIKSASGEGTRISFCIPVMREIAETLEE